MKLQLTKAELLQIIREEAQKSTKKYDDDSALKGDQDELPDALQKGIIDKAKKEKNEMDEMDEMYEMEESLIRISRKDFVQMIREEMHMQKSPAVELDADGLAGMIADLVGGMEEEPQKMGGGGTAGMAKQHLSQLARTAQSLHDRLSDEDELPEWTQSKIAVAEDSIDAVADHLGYKMDKPHLSNESRKRK